MAFLKDLYFRIRRRIKGNRTRAVATALAILGMGELYAPQVFSPQVTGILMFSFGVLQIMLRQYTDTPAGKPEVDVYDDSEAA